MFGLMRGPKGCATDEQTKQQYKYHRKHYCGTCKVMGVEYNQTSRLLLNFDTVFLAELLSLLDNEDTDVWEDSLQKVNLCWAMPKKEMPF